MARQSCEVNPRVRLGFVGLAETVGVDQERHSAVGSDLIGTKNPFSGQASSQSKRPRFRGAEIRACWTFLGPLVEAEPFIEAR